MELLTTSRKTGTEVRQCGADVTHLDRGIKGKLWGTGDGDLEVGTLEDLAGASGG